MSTQRRHAGIITTLPTALLAGSLLAFLAATPARAVTCLSQPGYVLGWELVSGDSPTTEECLYDGFWCEKAKEPGVPYIRQTNPACDPQSEPCAIQLRVPLELPGTEQNVRDFGLGSPTPWVYWFGEGSPPAECEPGPTTCGEVGICGVTPSLQITVDFIEVYLQIGGVSCDDLTHPQLKTYSLSVFTCPAGYCEKRLDVPGLDLSPASISARLGCEDPRRWSCPEADPYTCPLCLPGGASPAGGGPGIGPGLGDAPGPFGPGAALRYAAGGVGGPGFPGSVEWNVSLGRYWSHDYAQRIVAVPDESHVWFLSPFATYREFFNLSAGVYQSSSPSDELRELRWTGSGWELEELDGMVHSFDSAGRWTQSVDRNGNAKTATYTGGQLTSVALPNDRREDFTYLPGGKLATITEVGVDGTTSRTWSLTWSGDNLNRIDAPDSTALEFVYEDARHPGYLTRMERVGTSGGRRVERAWALDAEGNVIDTWAGDASATGPDAVDRWQYTFDDPKLPSVTLVTDPLGNVATYTVGRDTLSRKPKLLELTGDCPACGLGPNAQLEYGDATHPLRPTLRTDGRGNQTLLAYDAHGQVTSRTEALGTARERTTTWEYHPDFPAFPTLISRPSTAGGEATRETVMSYNTAGDLIQRTESGMEDGAAFSYSTDFTPNSAGQVLTVDPPGYTTDDQTRFTYDPARGDLVATSRTDPLVGTTFFDHDAFNRRTGVTDPNGVLSETRYDALDRVTHTIQRSSGAAAPGDPIVNEDLVTEQVYDQYGDLFQTLLPEGNVIEYGYDAANRLVSIERKPDGATPGERTLFILDAAGNRVREERQSWDGAAWVTEATTDFVYSRRCQLDRMVQAPGTAEEAVTEYQYDCNGDLQYLYDANHAPATDPPTQLYAYDELDRLTSVSQPWGGAGGGDAVTSYSYDVQDHLTAVTDAEGNVTTYTYSDRDLLTQEVPPASGTTTFTYNAHGEQVGETDARGVTVTRTVDELDRVTLVDYPDDSLDTSYTYGDQEASPPAFSLGRLTAVTRNGAAVAYERDRYGRLLQDGGLARTYDENGNAVTLEYPGGVTAVYDYDFADRPVSLTVQRLGEPDEEVVTAAGYLPSGPLTGLTLGNGLAESRAFDGRYVADRITLAGTGTLLDWDYTTDEVGNVTAITDLLNPAASRSYAYQDVQSFLTQAYGPWGTRSWAYDTIGNRLTETADGLTDTYLYTVNGDGGNTPLLSGIQLAGGGNRLYTYGPAGHLEQVNAGGNLVLFTSDDAGRLARLERPAPQIATLLRYDGRGFLAQAREERTLLFADGFESGDLSCWSAVAGGDPGNPANCSAPSTIQPATIEAVYDSQGLLHALFHTEGTAPLQSRYLFHLGGRPVAQLTIRDGTPGTWLYLTTDHLGTPIAATDPAGALTWQGGFEPFGEDWQAGTPTGASENGLPLRLPGQWWDGTWQEASLGVGVYYNLYRWYQPGTGRYTRPDPFGILSDISLYRYAQMNPIVLTDPLGLTVSVCCKKLNAPFGGYRHCYFRHKESGDTLGFHTKQTVLNLIRAAFGSTGKVVPNHGFDRFSPNSEECEDNFDPCDAQWNCATRQGRAYPSPSRYRLTGPNSNTFAGNVARACGLRAPDVAGTGETPGWYDNPGKPVGQNKQ